MLSVRMASSRLVAGIALFSLVAVVVGLMVLASPELRAQGAAAASEEGAAPGEPVAVEAAPTPPEAPGTGQEEAAPPEPPTTPEEAGPAEKPKPPTIQVAGRERVDPELVAFREDLARRTSPLDKAEMIENERIWCRNVRQYSLNALPPHKDLGAECDSAWWSDYCGN